MSGNDELTHGVSAGSNTSVQQAHEQLKQRRLKLEAELQQKNCALKVHVKRAQIADGIIAKLRDELGSKDDAVLRVHAQSDQRVADLEAQLASKDAALEHEKQKLVAYERSATHLQEAVQSLCLQLAENSIRRKLVVRYMQPAYDYACLCDRIGSVKKYVQHG